MPLTLSYYKGLTEGLNLVVAFTVIVSTSFPGFSLLRRERTLVAALVAAGYVEMSVNKLRGGDRSPIKFCRLDDEILSGVGRKFLLQNDA